MKKRIIYLDILRVIAIFAVVLMHASSEIQLQYELDVRSVPFFVANIFDTVTRFAVPLFLMISGRLMINSGKCIVN